MSDENILVSDEPLHDDDEYENLEFLELVKGRVFSDWHEFKNWIHRFAKKEGFDYKIRSSEKDQGIMRRVIYECTRSGSHKPQVTCDPTKRRDAHSLRIQCPWRLNVSRLKSSEVVKINSFNNDHNHHLTPLICEIAPHFRKLTSMMLADIEKYVIQGRMDSGSIYPLLRHDYPDQPINKKDLYNAVYKFRQKNNPGNTDASQMLHQLLEWKDLDPLWIVKPQLKPMSRRLISLLWMSSVQRDLYSKYNDVLIVDTTYNTNRFQMMLCIITVIDNNYRDRKSVV